jgi:hypothetical protein
MTARPPIGEGSHPREESTYREAQSASRPLSDLVPHHPSISLLFSRGGPRRISIGARVPASWMTEPK